MQADEFLEAEMFGPQLSPRVLGKCLIFLGCCFLKPWPLLTSPSLYSCSSQHSHSLTLSAPSQSAVPIPSPERMMDSPRTARHLSLSHTSAHPGTLLTLPHSAHPGTHSITSDDAPIVTFQDAASCSPSPFHARPQHGGGYKPRKANRMPPSE